MNRHIETSCKIIRKVAMCIISTSRLGRDRIDRTMYYFQDLTEVTYENYAFVITSDLFNEESITDYQIAVIGDIHDELHSYVILLVDPKNEVVLGYEPVK